MGVKHVRAKSNATPGPSRGTTLHQRSMRPEASLKQSFPHSSQFKLAGRANDKNPHPRPSLPSRAGAFIPSPSDITIRHSVIQHRLKKYTKEVDEERGGRLCDVVPQNMPTSLLALGYYEPFPARSLTYQNEQSEGTVPAFADFETWIVDEDVRKAVEKSLREEEIRWNHLSPWDAETTPGPLFRQEARPDRMVVELPPLDQGWQGLLAYLYLNYADGKNELPAAMEVTQLPPIDKARRYRDEELPLLYDDWRQIPNQAEPPRFCLVMPPMPQPNSESRSLPLSIDLAVPSLRCANILQNPLLEPA